MKLAIGDYDVTITAKHRTVGRMTQKDATRYLLNELVGACWAAEKSEAYKGFDALANRYREFGDNIFSAVKMTGFYDGFGAD